MWLDSWNNWSFSNFEQSKKLDEDWYRKEEIISCGKH
jgi:hypothetical protein